MAQTGDLISMIGNGADTVIVLEEPLSTYCEEPVQLECNDVCDRVEFEGEMLEWLKSYGQDRLMDKKVVDAYVDGFLSGHVHEAAHTLANVRTSFFEYLSLNRVLIIAQLEKMYPTVRSFKIFCSLTLNQIFYGESYLFVYDTVCLIPHSSFL